MMKPIDKISGVFRNGQYIPHLARDGRPKKLTVPAIAHGMRRQTTGEVHSYLHGQAANDETADKLHLQGRVVPINNAMGSERPECRGADYGPSHGSKILRDAGSLGLSKHGIERLPSKR